MKNKFTLLASAVLFVSQVNAHHVDDKFDLADLSKQASLVFKGTVVAVDFRDSRSTKDLPSLPHTFVTYEIEDVLHGNPGVSKRKIFTLRFLGGQNEKGNIMLVNVSPKFDIGDQDILFVAKNGEAECPLVNCANGRFRVLDGLVFNEYGQQVIISEKGEVKLGRVVVDPVFSSFKVGDRTFEQERHQSSSQDNKSYLDIATVKQNKPFDQLNSDRFITRINNVLFTTMPDDPRGKGKVANHSDKAKSFDFTLVKAGRPEKVIQPSRTISDKDMQQMERLQKN